MVENTIDENSYPLDRFKDKAIVINRSNYLDPKLISFPIQAEQYIEFIAISNGLINDRIEKLACSLIEDYSDKKLTILVIMKGAVVFANILQSKLGELAKSNKNVRNDIFWEYVTVSSYNNDQSTGGLTLKSNESILIDLKDQHVLVVEDMFDTGSSLEKLHTLLSKYQFKTLKYAVLFLKKNPVNVKYLIDFDYLGFIVPNDFMVGFGLDYNNCFRDLQHLCTINKKGIEEFRKVN